MIEPFWVDISDVCILHNEIIAESGGTSGILNQGALDSTLNKPKNLYHYSDDLNLYELAASYGYGLTKNHCFIDGNKRIAFITVYTFLLNNGIEIVASEIEATNIFLDLAASLESQEKDMDKLANWLQANSNLISDR